MVENLRATALSVLLKCERAGQYSNIALDTALSRNELSAADRALLTALVYGVLERRFTLDACIVSLSERETSDDEAKMLLRLGLYQLLYLDRVPDHAAVNETVAAAPRRLRGFVNAVLRAFLRGGKQIPLPDAERDTVGYLSVRYSVLPALCKRFLGEFGRERTESLLAAFEGHAPVTLRVNTLKTTREALSDRLKQAGFSPIQTPEAPHGLLLASAPVATLNDFAEGSFFVQDEASQLCVEALDAKSGMRVLDTCACPGSKSFGTAISMENRGEVISCDLHKNKLSLITSGAERLGISCIQTLARDAREPMPEWEEGFDRVLCDVPCSGFGVLAKKPELRGKDPCESAALPDIQLAILNRSAGFVRKDGLLVYSTCTLLARENGENVRRFLNAHSEFTLLRERTLAPDTDGTDGFYFAVLQKHGKN